jgi:hypothetical protein
MPRKDKLRPAKEKPSTARRQLRTGQLLKILKEYADDLRKIIEALRKKRLH